MVAGLRGPWKVLAKGLHFHHNSGNVTVLTRFLLQWDRIMPNLLSSTNFISLQQVQYVEQVLKTYNGPPMGFFPVPDATNGDNVSNENTTATMNWILSFAETHLVVETERYFSNGTITPFRVPDDTETPTGGTRFILGGGNASLKLTHVDPTADKEKAELVLKACLFVPDSSLRDNHISLPALQREGCFWSLEGTVMRVWSKNGTEILQAEIERTSTGSKWVVTNVKGKWQ
jgi:hypothetical protein